MITNYIKKPFEILAYAAFFCTLYYCTTNSSSVHACCPAFTVVSRNTWASIIMYTILYICLSHVLHTSCIYNHPAQWRIGPTHKIARGNPASCRKPFRTCLQHYVYHDLHASFIQLLVPGPVQHNQPLLCASAAASSSWSSSTSVHSPLS